MSRTTSWMPRLASSNVTLPRLAGCRESTPARSTLAGSPRLRRCRVVRRPARRILEQTNRANPALSAEVEPVMRALRHADQIAWLHFDGEHGTALRVNVK